MSDAYSISHYASMHADRGRVEPYIGAVERAVTPDSFVIEIGTGTGLIACAAARAGARRVVAIEPNPVIELAKQIAGDNGLSDRIEFVRGLSTDFETEDRADIIVSDLRGALPHHPGHIRSVVDARERLLAPDGRLIAASDRVFAAPVRLPQAYSTRIGFCDDGRIDASALRHVLVNRPFHHDVTKDDLVAGRRMLTTVDYDTVVDESFDATVEFEPTSAGLVHGFVVWFITEIDETERISTGPSEPFMAYGRLVYPVGRPFEVAAGDRIEFRYRTHRVGGGYVTAWSGGVPGDAARRFDQSTLDALLFDRHRRVMVAQDGRPRATERSAALATLLGAMDGAHTFEELVAMVEAEHGDLFRDDRGIRGWVSDMVAAHGRR